LFGDTANRTLDNSHIFLSPPKKKRDNHLLGFRSKSILKKIQLKFCEGDDYDYDDDDDDDDDDE
jgi:hypothetical protein